MAEMQIKRLYITRPRMEAFPCGIRAIGLCSGVNIKLEILVVEKMSLFPTLADLRRFLRNCSLSTILSMQTLFGAKPVFISTRMVYGQGL
jgi:hypothetical protein